MKHNLNLILLLLSLLSFACAEPQREHDHTGQQAAAETTYTCPMHPQVVQQAPGTCPICHMNLVPVSQSGKDSGELMLSDRQIALGNISTTLIKQGEVASASRLTGKLVLDETQTEVISSRAQGRIEKLYLKETGQAVQQGQPLYALYSEELLALQREYLLALKQNNELGQENPRFATLLEAARQKLLLYGLTQSQISGLAKTEHLSAKVTFVAPVSGVVTNIAATEGQYVPEGAVLYRLGKLDRIWVEAELYPQEIAQVKSGDQVLVTVQGMTQEPILATVTFISPEYQQGSQVATLRAELQNPDGRLLPGMQATVSLPGNTGTNLVLPTDAVIRNKNGNHVWVQTSKNLFQARMVTLGQESADRVAILSGLHQHDSVVTSGAYLLYSEFVLKKGADPVAHPKH